ncbi:hypothetical protein OROGR_031323 [Orobanche gracilis]
MANYFLPCPALGGKLTHGRKRERGRSTSSFITIKCASPLSVRTGTKDASEKLKKEAEEKKSASSGVRTKIDRRRNCKESSRRNSEESLNTDEIKLEIERRLEEGRKKLVAEVAAQLEKEKEAALLEARRREEQAQREREKLERMMEENKRKIEEAQRREALEQQRREEERYRELEERQRQKEEFLRRKKQQEEEERANQMKLLGKNKSRPKLSFVLGLK